MAEKDPPPTIEGGQRVPILWQSDDDLPTLYATNVVVSHTDDEVVLRFYEARMPIIEGSVDHMREEVEKLKGVPARCLARVVMTPARAKLMLKVMQKNMERAEAVSVKMIEKKP